MSMAREDLHRIIDSMNDQQASSVYDFARYIIDRQIEDFWKSVDAAAPDEYELSAEEKRDIEEADEFKDWEDVKHELGL